MHFLVSAVGASQLIESKRASDAERAAGLHIRTGTMLHEGLGIRPDIICKHRCAVCETVATLCWLSLIAALANILSIDMRTTFCCRQCGYAEHSVTAKPCRLDCQACLSHESSA